MTEPAQSTLRQGETGRCLDCCRIVIPFDIFESEEAAHVKGIQSIVITDGQVPRLRSIKFLFLPVTASLNV